jgi:hypothetical protein
MSPEELRRIAAEALETGVKAREAMESAPPGKFRDTGLRSVRAAAGWLATWAEMAAKWADGEPPGTTAAEPAAPATRRWAPPP